MDCSHLFNKNVQSSNSGTNVSYQLGNSYVRVFYRICSLEKPNWDLLKIRDSTVFIRKLQQLKDVSKAHQSPSFWEFSTDGVFHNCAQEDVYNKVIENVIEKLTEGNNSIIVAFGQTGTGKSATLSGLEFVSDENYGVAPRLLRNLLKIKKSFQGNKKMSIKMSYLEFSKTAVYDLFKEYPNNIDVWHVSKAATKIKITSEHQALKELYFGEARKDTKENKKYFSHINTSVLSFDVIIEDLNYSESHQIEARLHLIDMAGSDTVGNLSCIFKSKGEVGSANLAKTSLEQFFLCLIERSQKMIRARRRTNPLIYFLKDDLSSQSSLRFIGHISTSRDGLQMALSMMRFGQLIRGYTPVVKNVEQPSKMSPENKVKYLQRQIQELQEERIQNSILLNQDLTTNMDSERIEHLQKMIKDYLSNQISEIDVMRVTDASMIFKMFRDMYNQRELEKQKMIREGSTSFSRKATESELSLPKKKGSVKSSSTLNTVKTAKERRRSKKSKDLVDDRHGSMDKTDKQISVQSFFGTRTKSQTLRRSQERSSVSMSQIGPKRKKSKYLSVVKRPSMIKRKSTSSFAFGCNPEMLLIPDNVPENIDAWNTYVKETSYSTFLDEYKQNEKNILDTHTNYLDSIKVLQEEKEEIDAMKQEMLEAKMMMKYKSTESDKYTEAILNEAEAKCRESKKRAQLALSNQKEMVLRSLAELKTYLNNRKGLKKELASSFETYCRERFNIPLPQARTLSLVEMMRDSVRSFAIEDYPDEDNITDEIEEKISSEMQLKDFRKMMEKERNKVIRLRTVNSRKIFDKKCLI